MIRHLNQKLYTDLPLDELEERVSIEELEDRLELFCWSWGGEIVPPPQPPPPCVNIVLPTEPLCPSASGECNVLR